MLELDSLALRVDADGAGRLLDHQCVSALMYPAWVALLWPRVLPLVELQPLQPQLRGEEQDQLSQHRRHRHGVVAVVAVAAADVVGEPLELVLFLCVAVAVADETVAVAVVAVVAVVVVVTLVTQS